MFNSINFGLKILNFKLLSFGIIVHIFHQAWTFELNDASWEDTFQSISEIIFCPERETFIVFIDWFKVTIWFSNCFNWVDLDSSNHQICSFIESRELFADWICAFKELIWLS